MRIVACPTCRKLKTERSACTNCGEIASILQQLKQPGAGQAVVYPFTALRKLSPAVRRQVAQAIHNGRRG